METVLLVPRPMHPEIVITFEKACECRRKDFEMYNTTKYSSAVEMEAAEEASFMLRLENSDESY